MYVIAHSMTFNECLSVDVDDSLQVDETPVKEYDVENFTTLWPALSGEVDVPGDRTRHLSGVSTKSDRSNCSDLSTVFSPIKNIKVIKTIYCLLCKRSYV